MKKTILLFAVMLISASLFSQDLGTIIKKYSKATGLDAMEKFKTTKIEASLSQGAMDITMTMYEKKPDKFRVEMNMAGMNIITVLNGDKGWALNPMAGSEPVALDAEQIKSAQTQKIMGSSVAKQFEDGKVELLGEVEFDEKACYKLKIDTDMGDAFTYIDKKEFLIVGTEMEMSQNGQTFSTVITMKDYRDVKGYKMSHKMISSTMGQIGVIEFKKVEFDIAIDDSIFKIK